jgi:hypothetical protein
MADFNFLLAAYEFKNTGKNQVRVETFERTSWQQVGFIESAWQQVLRARGREMKCLRA